MTCAPHAARHQAESAALVLHSISFPGVYPNQPDTPAEQYVPALTLSGITRPLLVSSAIAGSVVAVGAWGACVVGAVLGAVARLRRCLRNNRHRCLASPLATMGRPQRTPSWDDEPEQEAASSAVSFRGRERHSPLANLTLAPVPESDGWFRQSYCRHNGGTLV